MSKKMKKSNSPLTERTITITSAAPAIIMITNTEIDAELLEDARMTFEDMGMRFDDAIYYQVIMPGCPDSIYMAENKGSFTIWMYDDSFTGTLRETLVWIDNSLKADRSPVEDAVEKIIDGEGWATVDAIWENMNDGLDSYSKIQVMLDLARLGRLHHEDLLSEYGLPTDSSKADRDFVLRQFDAVLNGPGL